jgi:hypothetical protein
MSKKKDWDSYGSFFVIEAKDMSSVARFDNAIELDDPMSMVDIIRTMAPKGVYGRFVRYRGAMVGYAIYEMSAGKMEILRLVVNRSVTGAGEFLMKSLLKLSGSKRLVSIRAFCDEYDRLRYLSSLMFKVVKECGSNDPEYVLNYKPTKSFGMSLTNRMSKFPVRG